MIRRPLVLRVAVLLGLLSGAGAGALAFAQEDHSSHSHGDTESLGRVRFQISCRPEVAPEFTRATALLHSFGYEESRRSYEAVAAKDPVCGMRAAKPNTTSGKLATNSVKFGSPGSHAADSSTNRVETWHYRREVLPKAVPFQQVDFQFVTKQGYGDDVLQRDSNVVNTLTAAKP